MSSEALVEANQVSKKYCHSRNRSLVYGLQDIARELFGTRRWQSELRPEEFWALEDISFELHRGDCLGLIGPNGAGKSTLVKLLNGIILPDVGQITLRGRIGALVELGAGFHPMLTGRENLLLAGSVYGLSNAYLKSRFDEIVAFSELDDFIDTPVKHYSSGMLVRLGFSVAAHIEPDVLLLDEVLAVGDMGFRAKCFNTIGKMASKSAVILVSHSMPQVARIANKALLLNKGKSIFQGPEVTSAISKYYSLFEKPVGSVTVKGDGRAEICSIEVRGADGSGPDQIEVGEDILIDVELKLEDTIEKPILIVGILNQELSLVGQCSTDWGGFRLETGGVSHISAKIEQINLNPANYFVMVTVTDVTQKEILVQHYATDGFSIKGDTIGYGPIQLAAKWEKGGSRE